MTIESRLEYRWLMPSDFPSMRRLLEETRPSFGGISGDRMYDVLMRESLLGRNLRWIVAVNVQQVVGFIVACIDRQRFWRHFFLRHPILIAQLLLSLAATSLRRVGNRASNLGIDGHTGLGESLPKWTDEGPHIAKLLYGAVAQKHRGLGITPRMLQALTSTLPAVGVTRIDGHIDSHNESSRRSVEKAGGIVYPSPGGGYFFTFMLSRMAPDG